MDKEHKFVFNAYLPPIQSAIKFGSDSARIQLEVPQTEMIKILALPMLTNTTLKVTIEIDE